MLAVVVTQISRIDFSAAAQGAVNYGFQATEPSIRCAAISWILRTRRPNDDAIEHAADNGTVKYACMHSETNDATGILIHDDHYPVGLENQRFTSKEIYAP